MSTVCFIIIHDFPPDRYAPWTPRAESTARAKQTADEQKAETDRQKRAEYWTQAAINQSQHQQLPLHHHGRPPPPPPLAPLFTYYDERIHRQTDSEHQIPTLKHAKRIHSQLRRKASRPENDAPIYLATAETHHSLTSSRQLLNTTNSYYGASYTFAPFKHYGYDYETLGTLPLVCLASQPSMNSSVPIVSHYRGNFMTIIFDRTQACLLSTWGPWHWRVRQKSTPNTLSHITQWKRPRTSTSLTPETVVYNQPNHRFSITRITNEQLPTVKHLLKKRDKTSTISRTVP